MSVKKINIIPKERHIGKFYDRYAIWQEIKMNRELYMSLPSFSFSLVRQYLKSIRLKWGFKGAPYAFLSTPPPPSISTGSAGGARRNDIDLGETCYQKMHPPGKSYDAFVHYSPSRSFLRTLHPMWACLFYTLNNRLTYFNPALLKILGSRKLVMITIWT